jgi:hypothetical protein
VYHICTFENQTMWPTRHCWLKKKQNLNCSTWVCTFSSIKREPNLVPLYRIHLVLYPKALWSEGPYLIQCPESLPPRPVLYPE